MKISLVGLVLRVLVFGSTLFVLGACAVSRTLPVDDWNRFPPYETKFRSFFDSTAGALDPVEGIWITAEGSRLAIVRDLRYAGFGFVAVPLYRGGGAELDLRRLFPNT